MMHPSSQSNSIRTDFLVIGDGIAGRAVAAGLNQLGVDVKILCPPATTSSHSGGVQIAKNGWRALGELGCAAACWHEGLRLSQLRLVSLSSHTSLVTLPLTDHRQPYASVVRGGLMAALGDMLADKHRLHGKITSIASQNQTAAVRVGLEGKKTITANWVIGADGVRGFCRGYVTGATTNSNTIIASRTAHRFVIPLARLPRLAASQETQVWLGKHGHIVHYPLASNGGEAMLNMVVVAASPATTAIAPLVAQHPWLGDVYAKLPQAVTTTPIAGMQPAPCWLRGRVVLAGDAAHPMPPHLAQGASQALLDAARLKAMLADKADANQVMPLWAGRRMGEIASMQPHLKRASRLFQPPPYLAGWRNLGLSLVGRGLLAESLDRIWQ